MRQYYDTLFQDLEGTKSYEAFVRKHIKGTNVLEFACGTGDLLNLLLNDYVVEGIDLDPLMLNKAIKKYPQLENKVKLGNFLEYSPMKSFDTLICVGDSLNYLSTKEELEQFVEVVSKTANTLILDMHHLYRLSEFQDPYYEEGSTDMFDYMYVIEVEHDNLVHTINFLDGTFDQVVQWVFDPRLLVDMLIEKGYCVDVFTDFDTPGLASEGEKIMLVCNKGSVSQ